MMLCQMKSVCVYIESNTKLHCMQVCMCTCACMYKPITQHSLERKNERLKSSFLVFFVSLSY